MTKMDLLELLLVVCAIGVLTTLFLDESQAMPLGVFLPVVSLILFCMLSKHCLIKRATKPWLRTFLEWICYWPDDETGVIERYEDAPAGFLGELIRIALFIVVVWGSIYLFV